ncbi:type II secretion system F family protein [Aeromicrobium sp.]|uniref:type II secretion system F family protein n=1 Tax=Aeromicrobium sp. TaxID=1871063 RepID=UPI003C50C975
MTAGILAALAVWCGVPASSRPRRRAMFGQQSEPRRPNAALLSALISPLAVAMVLGSPMGTILGLALAPLVYRGVGRLESSASRRRAARVGAQLPAALDLMVATLTVGCPPVRAFALSAEATADPLGSDLGLVAGRLAVASDPDAVWRGLGRDASLAPVARAFRRAETSGMPVADIVAGVADDLRREQRAHRRQQSGKVAVRTAAPLGVCFLPAFFLVGIVPTIIATFGSFNL